MAEVQVDQRVELREARQPFELVAGQAEGFDVAQASVSGLQDPYGVVGQIHVDEVVQVLQPQDNINCAVRTSDEQQSRSVNLDSLCSHNIFLSG